MTVSQVLLFGGGLSAEWLGGTFVNNTARLGLAVLKHTTFTAGNVTIAGNTVRRGAIYGEGSILEVWMHTCAHGFS
jgi:hypothetical protein